MSSRKEQKERLRIERQKREAEAKAAERRRQLIGYGVGGVIALTALIVVAVLLLSGGDDSKGSLEPGKNSDLLPEGGSVPDQKITDLAEAAAKANCELKSIPGKSRDHSGDINEKIPYESDPPTSGKHFQTPAPDSAFTEPPKQAALVHTLEHGRVIVWFKPTLPRQQRANLRNLYEDDDYHIVLTSNRTMKYAVAATAWNAEPTPNGTGRLLGCLRFTPEVYDALQAFRDEHRDNGPEAVG